MTNLKLTIPPGGMLTIEAIVGEAKLTINDEYKGIIKVGTKFPRVWTFYGPPEQVRVDKETNKEV